MNNAQQVRFHAYLDELQPHIRALREAGYPVEVSAEIDGERVVVSASVDVNDTRVPVEYAETSA